MSCKTCWRYHWVMVEGLNMLRVEILLDSIASPRCHWNSGAGTSLQAIPSYLPLRSRRFTKEFPEEELYQQIALKSVLQFMHGLLSRRRSSQCYNWHPSWPAGDFVLITVCVKLLMLYFRYNISCEACSKPCSGCVRRCTRNWRWILEEDLYIQLALWYWRRAHLSHRRNQSGLLVLEKTALHSSGPWLHPAKACQLADIIHGYMNHPFAKCSTKSRTTGFYQNHVLIYHTRERILK